MRGILLGVMLLFVVACGGKNAAPNNDNAAPNATTADGPYMEPAPDAAALKATLDALRPTIAADVEEGLRDDLTAYVLATAPAALTDPTSAAEAWVFLGFEAALVEDFATAAWCFLEAYALAPDDAWVLSQVGFALLALDYPDEAKDALLRAYELDPELYPTLLTLGFVYERVGDYNRALFFYLVAQAREADNIYFAFPLARAFMGVGRYETAAALLGDVARALPDLADVADALDDAESGMAPQPPTPGLPGDGGDFLERYAGCTQQWLENQQTVLPATEIWRGVEERVNLDFRTHQDAADACEAACAPLDDACVADCWGAQCAADAATVASAGPQYVAGYWDWYGATGRVDSMFAACAFEALYDNRRFYTDEYILWAEDQIWVGLEGSLQDRMAAYEYDVVPTLQGWGDDVASVCDAASTAYEQIDPMDLLAGVPSENHEICGPGVCVKWEGANASVDISTGPIQIQASGQSFGGFTAALGYDIWSNDAASVSVMMRFDSKGGSSIGVEGKVTGPISGLEQKVALSTR